MFFVVSYHTLITHTHTHTLRQIKKKTIFRWSIFCQILHPFRQIRDTKEANKNRKKKKIVENCTHCALVELYILTIHKRIRKSRSFLRAIRRKENEKKKKKTAKERFPPARRDTRLYSLYFAALLQYYELSTQFAEEKTILTFFFV